MLVIVEQAVRDTWHDSLPLPFQKLLAMAGLKTWPTFDLGTPACEMSLADLEQTFEKTYLSHLR
jgi:hypothetical protein